MSLQFKIGQPRFLTQDEVLTLHAASLDAYGGVDGILDVGKLEASLAMPEQGFGREYAHAFPFGMAAAYGYHIAMNHAFRDGNKRTAFASMVVFLRLNGWDFSLADEHAADVMLELIAQRRDKIWLSDQIAARSRLRLQWELRDFLSQIPIDRFWDVWNSTLSSRRVEIEASSIEASDAIPLMQELIRQGDLFVAKQDSAATLSVDELHHLDREAYGRYAQAALLQCLFRLAEDMGYEW